MDTPTLQQFANLQAAIADLQAHVYAANQRLADHDHRLAALEHADVGTLERENPSAGSGQAVGTLERVNVQPRRKANP